MSIKKDDVRYVAKLARLRLSDKEVDYFATQLSRIIDYIDQLKEIDTSLVEPTSHVLPIQNVFREDKVKPSLKEEAVLKNSPECEGGLFKVPRIIEEL